MAPLVTESTHDSVKPASDLSPRLTPATMLVAHDWDNGSTTSGYTASSFGSTRIHRCHICKTSPTLTWPLYKCSECPRRYHRHCHKDVSIPKSDTALASWLCRRCLKRHSSKGERSGADRSAYRSTSKSSGSLLSPKTTSKGPKLRSMVAGATETSPLESATLPVDVPNTATLSADDDHEPADVSNLILAQLGGQVDDTEYDMTAQSPSSDISMNESSNANTIPDLTATMRKAIRTTTNTQFIQCSRCGGRRVPSFGSSPFMKTRNVCADCSSRKNNRLGGGTRSSGSKAGNAEINEPPRHILGNPSSSPVGSCHPSPQSDSSFLQRQPPTTLGSAAREQSLPFATCDDGMAFNVRRISPGQSSRTEHPDDVAAGDEETGFQVMGESHGINGNIVDNAALPKDSPENVVRSSPVRSKEVHDMDDSWNSSSCSDSISSSPQISPGRHSTKGGSPEGSELTTVETELPRRGSRSVSRNNSARHPASNRGSKTPRNVTTPRMLQNRGANSFIIEDNWDGEHDQLDRPTPRDSTTIITDAKHHKKKARVAALSYTQAVLQALQNAKNHRLQARGVFEWVKTNIAAFRVNINSVSATLSSNEGDRGKKLWVKGEHMPSDDDTFGNGSWYQLRPEFIDDVFETVPPKAPNNNPSQSKRLVIRRGRDIGGREDRSRRSKKQGSPSTPPLVIRSDSDEGYELRQAKRPKLDFSTEAEKAQRLEAFEAELKSLDFEPSKKASFFDDWPEFKELRQGAEPKERRIGPRLTRKQLFGKPAIYSRLGVLLPTWEDEPETPKPSPPSSSRQAAAPNALNGNHTVDEFFSSEDKVLCETVEEFLNVPKNLIPCVYNDQLAFRDGTRDEKGRLPRAKVIYKVGWN